MQTWSVYILLCGDNSLYCGITTDLERRVKQHNAGKAARYTRGRGPLRLLCSWTAPAKGTALSQERAFKKLSRSRKLARIRQLTRAVR